MSIGEALLGGSIRWKLWGLLVVASTLPLAAATAVQNVPNASSSAGLPRLSLILIIG